MKSQGNLELQITSINETDIKIIDVIYLTHIDSSTGKEKTLSFQNIKAIESNKFVINGINQGVYYGMLSVKQNGLSYNIPLGSVTINKGTNFVSKEINLGSVGIPK